MTKAELRREARAWLAALAPDAARRLADGIAERVLALPEVAGARRIFSCLSFGIELDTWDLVERLLADGRELFVPRADAGDGRLHVHPFPCPLVSLPFGLRQPAIDAPEIPEAEIDATLDVALVIGFAFDRRGVRLGHGAGFFDRFLAGRSFPTVGLAASRWVLARLPREPHDVAMTVVASERETIRVGAAAFGDP